MNKLIFSLAALLTLLCFSTVSAYANRSQLGEQKQGYFANVCKLQADTGKVLTKADQMPKFNGNLNQWISDHLIFPPSGSQGTVFVTFVVEKDGFITDVKITRSVDPSLDSAAAKCIRSMPKWIPGKEDGKPVRVQYTIPINFQMSEIAPSSVNPTTPPRVK